MRFESARRALVQFTQSAGNALFCAAAYVTQLKPEKAGAPDGVWWGNTAKWHFTLKAVPICLTGNGAGEKVRNAN